MGTTLTEPEFLEALRSFEHTAFRLEIQPTYSEPEEHDTVAKFLRGEPEPPTQVPGLDAWFEQVAQLTGEGKRIERVRVHDTPPTDYQRWVAWIDRWNRAAGERVSYLSRREARDIGLLPAAGDTDWWLLDSNRLVVMRFDAAGRRIHNELTTKAESVVQACAWRDLAVHHAVPASNRPLPPPTTQGEHAA